MALLDSAADGMMEERAVDGCTCYFIKGELKNVEE